MAYLNIKYNGVKKFFLILYLISFLIPFIFPSSYNLTTKFQFSILMPIALYACFSKGILDSLLMLFLLYTLILTFFGLPGSVFGYASSAVLGLFMAKKIIQWADCARGNMFKIPAVIYILLSVWLLYSANNPLMYGEYFGIASINYAGLSVAAFGVMYVAYFVYCNFRFGDEDLKPVRGSNLVFVLIFFILAFMFFQFGNRAIVVSVLTIFIYLLSRMKIKFLFTLLLCFAILLMANIEFVYEIIVETLAPGRSDLVELYVTELAGDQERALSIVHVFEFVLPSFGFCFECSDYMSFSSLANLFVYSFPCSLFFFFLIFRYYLISTLSIFRYDGKMFSSNIVLHLCFLSLLVTTLVQPDFLSVTALFYVVGVGLEVYKQRLSTECNTTKVTL